MRQLVIESPENALGMRSLGKSALDCCSDPLLVINGCLDVACGSFMFDFFVHQVLNE